MLLIFISILIVLVWIGVQDLRSRSVDIRLFFILTLLFVTVHYLHKQIFAQWSADLMANLEFLAILGLFIWLYVCITRKRWVILTRGFVCWGDILFALSLAFYLSSLNFFVVNLAGWIAVLVIVTIARIFVSLKRIPLAGLHALLFAFFLVCNFLFWHYNLMDDSRLLTYLIK